MRRFFAIVAATFGLLAAPFALADNFPNKTITLIVPFPPGGSTDVHLRAFSQLASKHLNQTIIVENRSGASGSVALTALKSTPPDGYKLSVVVPTSLRLPILQKMAYDPLTDFTYISMLSSYTYVVAVPANSPFKTWKDLLAYARANPGKLSYGNAGFNSSMHLIMENAAMLEGVKLNAVPYKGDGDQIQDLVSGQLDFALPSLGGIAPMVDSGKARMLAVFTKERASRFPDVPTLPEAGTNMIAEVPYGIVGPAGMNPKVVATLESAFRKASDELPNKQMLTQLGQVHSYLGSAEYKEWAQRTFAKEKELIKKFGKPVKD
ncbi:tripartite tricarboxylate transporter substrate binding protein [Herbaspirillum sp. GCM10030257]|uniref:tripartite tricarboxylate transporter substrate binding protein n=1 Tax=Herbaspirillum sp. GCM10030257 TaxID=3273393 RepID=UPI0036153A01